MYVKSGRFGPYVQLGDADTLPEGEKPRMASLFKIDDPETVTLDDASGCCRCHGWSASTRRRRGDHGPERTLRSVHQARARRPAASRARSDLHGHARGGARTARRAEVRPPAHGRRRRRRCASWARTRSRAGWSSCARAGSGPTSPTARPTRRCARATIVDDITLERAAELLADRRARGPAKPRRGTKAAKKATGEEEGGGQEGRGQEEGAGEEGRGHDDGTGGPEAARQEAAPEPSRSSAVCGTRQPPGSAARPRVL